MKSNHDIDGLISQLTLREKVSMLSGDLDFWPGMKALLKEDYYHNHPFPAAACERLGVPGIRFIDGPRGVVLFGGATMFPVSMARGASWDPELEERIGDAIGKEHRALGGNLFGGVCINLLRHPAWGRAQETYGEDPVLLGAMGVSLVRGVQRHAMACVKHYAANSMENARFKVDVTVDKRTLHEVYLPHFRECVDAGAMSVMSAYNSVNGEWCGQSEVLLKDILKKRWGFQGFVLTDFVFGVRDAKKAIEAGLDLEMPFRMVWSDNLTHLVEKGDVEEGLLDAALRRLIWPQFALPDATEYSSDMIGADEHKALAREVATKSMVLLKNEDKALPLAKGQNIVVVGELAAKANLGDRGSSDGRPDYVVTPLDGLRAVWGKDIQHYSDAEDPEAAAAIREADAVIVVAGYTHEEEGEYVAPPDLTAFAHLMPPPGFLRWLSSSARLRKIWAWLVRQILTRQANAARRDVSRDGGPAFGRGGDRDSLNLPADHENLIEEVCRLNKKTVVAIMGGSAILMENWRDLPQAIVMMWYPGMEGGHALADLLSGQANFSGRLPFAIPTDSAHLPDFDREARAVEYGFWHGHRLLEKEQHTPAFPFGFGLSYTEFELSNLQADKKQYRADEIIEVSLDVANTGTVAGDDVIQVYVTAIGSSVERPVKELKGFAKVHVGPGETRPLKITIPVSKLAYFDEPKDDFVVEQLEYELIAARHSLDTQALTCRIGV